jgi:hypothetical protein
MSVSDARFCWRNVAGAARSFEIVLLNLRAVTSERGNEKLFSSHIGATTGLPGLQNNLLPEQDHV